MNVVTVSFRLIICIVLLLTLAACKSGGGSSDSEPVPAAQTGPGETPTPPPPEESGNATALEGTWDHCNEFDKTSSRFTYVVQGNTLRQYKADYATPDCSGEAQEEDAQLGGGTFELKGESVDETGVAVRDLVFHVTETFFGIALAEDEKYDLFFLVSWPPGNEFLTGREALTVEERPNVLALGPYTRRE